MLQEQSQQLQNLLGSVTEALKAVNTRLDQQAETDAQGVRRSEAGDRQPDERRARDPREAGRQQRAHRLADAGGRRAAAVAAAAGIAAVRRPATPPIRRRPAPPPGGTRRRPAARRPPAIGASPQKLFDTALADYTAGQYDLAILGFERLHQELSRSPTWPTMRRSTSATAYLQDGKNDKAVEACDLAIRTYPDRRRDSRRVLHARASRCRTCATSTARARRGRHVVKNVSRTATPAASRKQRARNRLEAARLQS